MMENPRNEISELHLDEFTDSSGFRCWKTIFRTEVCSCSGFLADAMFWIKEVEVAKSVDDLLMSRSMKGLVFPNFEMLDAKIASALKRIISNQYCKRRISLEEQKAQTREGFLRGRQLAFCDPRTFSINRRS